MTYNMLLTAITSLGSIMGKICSQLCRKEHRGGFFLTGARTHGKDSVITTNPTVLPEALY